MSRIGLALSGGGFRAALYHLGVIRYLRDAGILPQITHITAVSGGRRILVTKIQTSAQSPAAKRSAMRTEGTKSSIRLNIAGA